MKKENKGITLIALIITIIVMLILVGVTVSVALNGGLFGTAKNATNKYTVEKEKELITEGYSNYQMQKIAPNNEDIDLLEKYFLGKSDNELLDDSQKFINNDIIPDAATSLVLIGQRYLANPYTNPYGDVSIRILYKSNIYRIFVEPTQGTIEKIKLESTQKDLKVNNEELELLKEYFSKEPDMDDNGIFAGNDIMPDAETSLIYIGESFVEDLWYDQPIMTTDGINVQYKNYIYKITTEGEFAIQLESVVLNSGKLEVQDANVEGNEDYGWTITFEGTGHVYTLLPDGTILEPEQPREKTDEEKLVEKYFLGEKGEGVDITSVMPEFFTNEDASFTSNEIISDADTNMNIFNKLVLVSKDENGNQIGYDLFVKYNKKIYKVNTIFNYEDGTIKTKEIKLIYSPTGREGEKVTYSYDGTKEHEEEWTILYDNGSTVEIVSPKTIGSLTLGTDNDIARSIGTYNVAISELNNYCRKQITNSNKISVRSAGSNPTNPLKENTKLYTSNYLKDGMYDNKVKSPDDNWEQDIIRMMYWGIIKTSDEQSYWLASRNVGEWGMESVYEEFGLRVIDETEGNMKNNSLWYYGTVKGSSAITNPVRPIVKIKQ